MNEDFFLEQKFRMTETLTGSEFTGEKGMLTQCFLLNVHIIH